MRWLLNCKFVQYRYMLHRTYSKRVGCYIVISLFLYLWQRKLTFPLFKRIIMYWISSKSIFVQATLTDLHVYTYVCVAIMLGFLLVYTLVPQLFVCVTVACLTSHWLSQQAMSWSRIHKSIVIGEQQSLICKHWF